MKTLGLLRKVKKNKKSLKRITNFKELSIKRINKSPKIPQVHFKTIKMQETVLSGSGKTPE